ncbi:hypothetical protein D3C86_2154470 [compost metagenome]
MAQPAVFRCSNEPEIEAINERGCFFQVLGFATVVGNDYLCKLAAKRFKCGKQPFERSAAVVMGDQ